MHNRQAKRAIRESHLRDLIAFGTAGASHPPYKVGLRLETGGNILPYDLPSPQEKALNLITDKTVDS